MDYVIHFGLEVIGQGVLVLAYKHACRKAWHQPAMWFAGTALTTVLTVNLVG